MAGAENLSVRAKTPEPGHLVSVVVVNYNGGQFLLNTVSSVLGSNVDLELFVVDNGSVDGSIRALRGAFGPEPRLRIIENGENLGFARANNIALARAAGGYLLLLNPDCVVEPDTLGRMVEALEADPRAGMAGCLIRNPDGTEQPGCRRAIPTPWTGLARVLYLRRWLPHYEGLEQVDLIHQPLPDRPVYVEAISGAFMMVRRSALEQVGLMDERYFLHCEDLDWCQMFHDAGWKILFVPGVPIVHHKGACSASRPVFVLWHKHLGMVRFYRKFLSRRYPAPLNLLVVLGVWLRFLAMLPLAWRPSWPSGRSKPLAVGPAALPGSTPIPLMPELRDLPVLVTGGTGFIGRRLVDELVRQGARVSVLTRSPDAVAALWPSTAVRAVRGDLEHPESLRIPGADPQVLLHLASHAHVLDVTQGDAEQHRAVTERGTRALLDAAARWGVERFVFVSSVKAMGEEDERRLDELSEPRPESPYGIAKLAAEGAVLAAGADGRMKVAVMRLPMVYGPGNKGNLPRMIQAIAGGRFPPLPEVGNRRSMIHVDDVVQALLLAAVSDAAAGQVYIVTDGRDYSTREIARLIAAGLARPVPRWAMPLWTLRLGGALGDLLNRMGVCVPFTRGNLRKLLGSAWYSSDKICRELGFRPHYDLERALPEILEEMGAGGGLGIPGTAQKKVGPQAAAGDAGEQGREGRDPGLLKPGA